MQSQYSKVLNNNSHHIKYGCTFSVKRCRVKHNHIYDFLKRQVF